MNGADGAGAGDKPEEQERNGGKVFPKLLSAVARSLTLDQPRRFAVQGRERAVNEVLVIDVETDRMFPAMGVGLALFVDDDVLVESQAVGENHYRFYSPRSDRLRLNAEVALGIAGTDYPRRISERSLALKWAE